MFVISPCGNCRQLMKEINSDNLKNTEVVLGLQKKVKLEKLLAHHDIWQEVKMRL